MSDTSMNDWSQLTRLLDTEPGRDRLIECMVTTMHRRETVNIEHLSKVVATNTGSQHYGEAICEVLSAAASQTDIQIVTGDE